MKPPTMPTKKSKPPCAGCGGSGQLSFFRGVSRFVMDWEDCPDCFGTGVVQGAGNENEKEGENTTPGTASDKSVHP